MISVQETDTTWNIVFQTHLRGLANVLIIGLIHTLGQQTRNIAERHL